MNTPENKSTEAWTAKARADHGLVFQFLGNTYRTNSDATIIEGNDFGTWNRTHSVRVYLEAKRVLKETATCK